MNLLRAFNEWRNPLLKCFRIGHRMKDEVQSGIVAPSRRFAIADSVVRRRGVCTRCPHKGEWVVTERRGIDALTMPESHWQIMRRDGIFVTSRRIEDQARSPVPDDIT